jgi:hypothetical protein
LLNFEKVFQGDKNSVNDKRDALFNFQHLMIESQFFQMVKVLQDELKSMNRLKDKLLTKNGVLLSQRLKISEQIKQLQATAEARGCAFNFFIIKINVFA